MTPKELNLETFVQSRTAGGDDPWVTIRVLRAALDKMQSEKESLGRQNCSMLRLLAVLAGDGLLKIRKADIDALPAHVGISIDECGPEHVSVKVVRCSCEEINHE